MKKRINPVTCVLLALVGCAGMEGEDLPGVCSTECDDLTSEQEDEPYMELQLGQVFKAPESWIDGLVWDSEGAEFVDGRISCIMEPNGVVTVIGFSSDGRALAGYSTIYEAGGTRCRGGERFYIDPNELNGLIPADIPTTAGTYALGDELSVVGSIGFVTQLLGNGPGIDDQCALVEGATITIIGISRDRRSVVVQYTADYSGGTKCDDGSVLMLSLVEVDRLLGLLGY